MENLVAVKLKELREKNSFSLQELAEQVGVAKQSIHKFENGTIAPSSETLIKIAEALNVSYSFFYENPIRYNLTFQNIKFREKHKISNQQFENEIKEDVCKYLSKFMELSAIMDSELEFENPLTGFEIAS